MLVAFVSDIHGNLEAFEAVLGDVSAKGAERLVCLGDVVGYGPDPVACVSLVQGRADLWLRGNHDRGALPEERAYRKMFRGEAREALDWTEAALDEASLRSLRSLAPSASEEWGLAAHGTLSDPMRYTNQPWEARDALVEAANWRPRPGLPLLWVGHTHLPLITGLSGAWAAEVQWSYGERVHLAGGWWLLNPGSVGQPRDGDPRARWALLDTTSLSVAMQAVSYDHERTQDKMRQAGLPAGLVELLGQPR
jgi:predicted phosphodiesterase